jgi:class 3 adenylate cyclase
MNGAILAEGGTVMQYVGGAVTAVFGAPSPQPDHAARALRAATRMQGSQAEVNAGWVEAGLAPFGLGIGLSTGPVAAALLGSDERVEYTLVGDTVNLALRLHDAARPAGSTVASAATVKACGEAAAALGLTELAPFRVKGRSAPVAAYRLGPHPVALPNEVGSGRLLRPEEHPPACPASRDRGAAPGGRPARPAAGSGRR